MELQNVTTVDSIQQAAEELNTRFTANSTVIFNIANGKFNYGVAGDAEVVVELFMKAIEVITKAGINRGAKRTSVYRNI